VVLSPPALFEELEMLEAKGVPARTRLKISPACPLILPSHVALDKARELARGDQKIGTTGRGIGPAYEDKVARRAVRLGDLFHRERFAAKLGEVLDFHNFVLREYFKQPTIDFQQTLDQYLALAPALKPMVADVTAILEALRGEGKSTLFEGAQGALLDIDLGTYPYVTSSNTTAGGAATGSGFGPRYFDYVLGIVKAYTTRVGSGPFPTELSDAVGEHLANKGKEFGSVTGRRRRTGWFDAVALRRSVFNNSVTGLCITKLDVLDGLDEVRICVEYRGKAGVPLGAEGFAECEPVYITMPGWKGTTYGVTDYAALPDEARAYLHKMEELVGVPIDIISTGPDRAQTIMLRHPFDG
jgi:adenylosuccinate synthase